MNDFGGRGGVGVLVEFMNERMNDLMRIMLVE